MKIPAFKNMSIRSKVVGMAVSASVLALLFYGVTIAFYQWHTVRSRLVHDLDILGQIISNSTTAALTFSDEDAARETLYSLQGIHHIISACIFTNDGEVFSFYTAGKSQGHFDPPPIQSDGNRFVDGTLITFQPVILDGERIGTLYLKADMNELRAMTSRVAFTSIIVVIFASIIAILVTSKLQNFVTKPILRLVETTKTVKEKQDFSLRARRFGDDELGTLVDGFNAMLSQIQARDLALRDAQHSLERRAEERTKKLTAEIKERERVEAQLREAKNSAELASRAKSEFLANMSHEIRTPMNGIIGMTRIALDSELSVEQRHYLNTVKSSAEGLLTIVNDILDFSKIEAGKLELEKVEFDLRGMIEETVGTIAVRAQEKSIEIAHRIKPEVPEFLIGDPVRLRQVVLNLIGNAIKFTETGEIVVEVSLSSPSASDSINLHFSVRDTGIGIPERKQRVIFDEFSQADGSTTRIFGGTGLGLTISKRLVEIMGGQIWVESEPGRGSNFHFVVKSVAVDKSGQHPDEAVLDPLKSVPILVVDKSKTSQDIIVELLEQWGTSPDACGQPESALQKVEAAQKRENPYRLLLVDKSLENGRGLVLAERIRSKRTLHQPDIVMLTTQVESCSDDDIRRLQLAGCLTKPVRHSPLFDAVMNASDSHRGRQKPATGPQTEHRITDGSERPLHVLVVEDNRVNQELALLILEKAGHTAKTADNGLEALEALKEESFDVVLMDVQMPVMDGLEATGRIRDEEKITGEHLAVIGLTAHAMQGDRDMCINAGMDDYVTKPIDPKNLFRSMKKSTSKRTGTGDGFQGQEKSPSPAPAGAPGTQAAGKRPGAGEIVVDTDSLLKRMGGMSELLYQVIDVFIENTPEMMSAIEAAVEAGDPSALRKAAHSLKGAVSNFGFDPATEAARKLEYLGRKGVCGNEVQRDYFNLRVQVDTLLASLRALREMNKSPL